jgi:hypothetical protein
MNNKVFLRTIGLIIFMLIAGCNAQPKDEIQSQSVTPVFVPVIITVGIPVPVTVTPTANLLSEQSVSSSGTTVVALKKLEHLEENGKWEVYPEGSPTWTLQNTDNPALNGKSLQCSITGGDSYSNVHCYQNLDSEPNANTFTLSLAFQFTPITTCNNQNTPSIVQAIEFTMNKWSQSKRYEIAVQWQNVGDGAPQWRYWNPSLPGDDKWVSINSNSKYCLDGQQWHTLVLEGDIIDDKTHYKGFTIDNFRYNLDLTVPPADDPGDDRLAIAVQVDGNEQETPYDLFIDNVNFTIQQNVDCNSIASLINNAKFNFQLDSDFLPYKDPTTQEDTSLFIVEKNTEITWEPACLMDLQYYQYGEVIFDKKNANSGQYNLSEESLAGGEIPLDVDTEIKIWRGGQIIKTIWVNIKE